MNAIVKLQQEPAAAAQEAIDRRQLEIAIAKMRAGVMAVVFAMVCGAGLFLATAWLVLQGGVDVGRHLRLLSQYFPGYSVTWGGAFVGMLYAALVGGIIGWTVSTIYNVVARRRG